MTDRPPVASPGHGVDRTVPPEYRAPQAEALIHETIRRLIGAMVEDLVGETRRRLSETDPGSAGAVRAAGQPIAAFSAAMAEQQRDLKAFLFRRMYRHYRVNRMITKAKWVVQRLFEQYARSPTACPTSGGKPPSRSRKPTAPAWWPTTSLV